MEPSHQGHWLPCHWQIVSCQVLRGIAGCCLAFCQIFLSPSAPAAEPPLSYNEHIRPILVENCFSCHGADSASREADLRLDRRDDAIEYGAIAPGDPDSSVILDRIFSEDLLIPD